MGAKLKLNEQKKQHRERGAPAARAKLGLLEKHKDYVKRAKDFHAKEDRIKRLREKAALRNKDEFYFGMISSRTKRGVHVQDRGNSALPHDLVQVLKTQDAGYIRTQKAIEDSRVRRLEEQVKSQLDLESAANDGADDMDDFDDMPDDTAESAPKRKHLVFTDAEDAGRSQEAKKLARQEKARRKEAANRADEKASRQAKKYRESLQAELDERRERAAALARALRELEMQRVLINSKGTKQALAPTQKGEGNGEEDDFADLDLPERGGVPKEREQGIATGARVWKWRPRRRR